MNFGKQLKEGLLTQNPVLVQLLGMCSTLAITTTISNGIGMGVSVTIILTLSNIFISLLRKVIPEQVRIAAYIVVIAGFVTMVDLLLQAFFPEISAIRELLGAGTLGGARIFPEEFSATLIAMPVGGFLTLGLLIALMQWAQSKGGK